MTGGFENKAIVVINDLRAVPVLAALKVARTLSTAGEAVDVVVSQRLLRCRDFGDYMPTVYKALVLFLLRACARVRIIDAKAATFVDDSESMGIVSSLYSITNDSGADSRTYPGIYAALVSLSKGAKELVQYLESQAITKLYLFNGRTASSYPLSKYAHLRKISISYYEYAFDFRGFKLYPCPPHAFGRLGYELMKFYKEATVPLPSMALDAKTFERMKIHNPYSAANKIPLTEDYDISMFLGSDHEYTALDPAICDLHWHGNLDFCKRVVAKYGPGKRYAIRCHPNQKADKNWRALTEEIAAFCSGVGADFYGPDSGISSHDLIKRSSVVATDLSSIAVDAVLLGKEVDVFGATDLRAILLEMNESTRSNPPVRKKVVAEMFGLSAKLFLIRFNRLEAALCFLFTKANAAFIKISSARATH
jgi:hypothetical protein